MSAVPPPGTRRALAAGLMIVAISVFGACEQASSPTLSTRLNVAADSTPGDTTHVPGDTTHVPGDTTHVPGDTTGVPGDTTHVPGDTIPGDTTGVPGDTTGIPGDTTGVPGDTTGVPGDTTHGPKVAHATIEVFVRQDTAFVGVPGAVVTVSRGASNHVVATYTTGVAGTIGIALPPGEYTFRLTSLPSGHQPTQPSEVKVHFAPGGEYEIRFFAQR